MSDRTVSDAASLWDLRAAELLERAASHAPTPGGGSVASVGAALGLGLVIMALEVSARRRDPHPRLVELLAAGRALLPQLSAGADEDVRAFGVYMTALARPKGSEAEKEARTAALQQAALFASEVPLTVGAQIVSALSLAMDSASVVARSVVSDVGAGAALLGGALRAALLTADINLPQVEEGRRDELRTRREQLQAEGEALERAALAAVAETLGGR